MHGGPGISEAYVTSLTSRRALASSKNSLRCEPQKASNRLKIAAAASIDLLYRRRCMLDIIDTRGDQVGSGTGRRRLRKKLHFQRASIARNSNYTYAILAFAASDDSLTRRSLAYQLASHSTLSRRPTWSQVSLPPSSIRASSPAGRA